MKGQISFVEYLASLILFITAVIFISFQLISFVPQYLTEVHNQRIRIDAYQISELLIDDPGKPTNWYSSTSISRMGLANDSLNRTNFLSLQKINAFDNYCKQPGGYANIKNNISAVSNFQIFLINRTGTSTIALISCFPPSPYSLQYIASVSRIVAIDSNDIGELVVNTG